MDNLTLKSWKVFEFEKAITASYYPYVHFLQNEKWTVIICAIKSESFIKMSTVIKHLCHSCMLMLTSGPLPLSPHPTNTPNTHTLTKIYIHLHDIMNILAFRMTDVQSAAIILVFLKNTHDMHTFKPTFYPIRLMVGCQKCITSPLLWH